MNKDEDNLNNFNKHLIKLTSNQKYKDYLNFMEQENKQKS